MLADVRSGYVSLEAARRDYGVVIHQQGRRFTLDHQATSELRRTILAGHTMKQLTANVFIETGLKGANHGFVTTSDGIVLIDTPHKPSDALRLKGEIERRGRLRYIINTEPHGDHWTGNAFFDVPVVAQEGVRARISAPIWPRTWRAWRPSDPKNRSCWKIINPMRR